MLPLCNRHRRSLPAWIFLLIAVAFATTPAPAAGPLLEKDTARPLRYRPDGTDFVIDNGPEFFNRSLYVGNRAFRVDAGDKPEFSLYLPGRGGNLRVGVRRGQNSGAKWLFDAAHVTARYRAGSMVYECHDPILGEDTILTLTALPLTAPDGLAVRAQAIGKNVPADLRLVIAFGGVNGDKGKRGGDIGAESVPVSQFFHLQPKYCQDNTVAAEPGGAFTVRAKPGVVVGRVSSAQASLGAADAEKWESADDLLASLGQTAKLPVIAGDAPLAPSQPLYVALQRADEAPASDALAGLFDAAEKTRQGIAGKIVVDTPDPFLNASAAALCVAADGVWDDASGSFMHGAVAWRMSLLGWRGPYSADALGWHDRMRRNLTRWSKKQNTGPIPDQIPAPESSANLSRNENALHSNGDMSGTHYDMNLVFIDGLFRHLLWTGDAAYAREAWPVIERHLAWERRLFRREFGPEKLPLYEAYCCIWASDDLAYNGGGATHSTAYNYWHNRMAARVAKMIGQDPAPYEKEADLIAKAMRQQLWLPKEGIYAEWKDLLGLQLTHPNPALWTFYHTVDSDAATPMEAWQMSRYIDTQIAHIPIHGPGVPDEGLYTLPTSNWFPYQWSTNNVVMAEVAHTALGYWQTGRADEAYKIYKGCLLDSMFMGLCPGNVGMCTQFDVARGESQRDFGDGAGMVSRALVEGVFGVRPDALAGELTVRPGFPAKWDRASLRHPDFNFTYRREGQQETWTVEPKFPKPMRLRLQIPAPLDRVGSVTINGNPTSWRCLDDSVGGPRIEINCPAGARQEVVIRWEGEAPSSMQNPAGRVVQNVDSEDRMPVWIVIDGQPSSEDRGGAGKMRPDVHFQFNKAQVLAVNDPQKSIVQGAYEWNGFHANPHDSANRPTFFVRLQQGDVAWQQPVGFTVVIPRGSTSPFPTDWKLPAPADTHWEPVPLAAAFNDKVTQIFRNEYLSPRSPYCSLALPKQGFGSWCHPTDNFDVDDSGLRAAADKNGGKLVLPSGVPFSTPGAGDSKNVVFTSQWDNYPRDVNVPLSGKAKRAYFLVAGSTNSMQSQFDNGELIVTYADGTTERLALRNPTTWWPIDQDYVIDDYAFWRPGPVPPRVDLKTGAVRVLDAADLSKRRSSNLRVPGGAATVLDLPLQPDKELKSLTVRALANEVVVGLMSATLAR